MRMLRLLPAFWLYFAVTAATLASEAAAPAEAEGHEQAPSVFTGDWAESAWTLAWFALLLLVLWKLAWKPLLKSLSDRQNHIQKEIDDAEKSRKQAQQVLDDYRSKLADAERQGREIINQRVKQAQSEAKDVESQSRKQIEQMKIRFESDLEREKGDAQEQLWTQAGDIIQTIGQEVFGKALNDEDNKRLISQAIERLKQAHRNPGVQ
ncbi:MAG: F0F1 ATP synthase subunit B [Sedimentisphaerales bacterium]|nr:F0F1 ATP synthase subunit B [Sedimentisphaerales bacterium]